MNFSTGVADVESMTQEPNLTRLDTAFYVAEVHLGITRLIDPEDVDVENPDEKSIMTYVAQFLHRYPEGSEGKVRRVGSVVLFNYAKRLTFKLYSAVF